MTGEQIAFVAALAGHEEEIAFHVRTMKLLGQTHEEARAFVVATMTDRGVFDGWHQAVVNDWVGANFDRWWGTPLVGAGGDLDWPAVVREIEARDPDGERRFAANARALRLSGAPHDVARGHHLWIVWSAGLEGDMPDGHRLAYLDWHRERFDVWWNTPGASEN